MKCGRLNRHVAVSAQRRKRHFFARLQDWRQRIHARRFFFQGNFGARKELMIAGVPVGREIPEAMRKMAFKEKDGSIIVVLATDTPLLPSQLKLLAKRASIGVARTGGFANNGSGDIFIAFSTASPETDEKPNCRPGKHFPKNSWFALPRRSLGYRRGHCQCADGSRNHGRFQRQYLLRNPEGQIEGNSGKVPKAVEAETEGRDRRQRQW